MTTTSITLTRSVPAPPERVFDAWVDPAQLAAWWWPQLTDTTYDVDARVGGHYRIVAAEAGLTVEGEYTEVDRPHRLAFTWVWEGGSFEDPDAVDDVVVTFEPVDGGTLLTVVHSSTQHLPEGGAEQGWSDVLDRLVRIAGRAGAGPGLVE